MINESLNRFVLQLSKVTKKNYRDILSTVKFTDNLSCAFISNDFSFEELYDKIEYSESAYTAMLYISYNWLQVLNVLYLTDRYKPKNKQCAYAASLLCKDVDFIDKKYVNISDYNGRTIYLTSVYSDKKCSLGTYFARKVLECTPVAQGYFSKFVLYFLKQVWFKRFGAIKTLYMFKCAGLTLDFENTVV